MSKLKVKGKKIDQNKHKKTKQNEAFDQEQQNFEVLQIAENNDAEYNELLKSSNSRPNIKKNAYFFNNQRYQGSKKTQDNQEEQEEQSPDSVSEENQIAGAIKSFQQQRKKQSKLLEEDVRQIDNEDEQYEIMRKKQKTSEETMEEAIGLRDQLNCEKMLIQYRYNEQTTLEQLKRFPNRNFPFNENLHSLQKQLEGQIYKNLNTLISAYSTYSQGIFNTSNLSTFEQQYQKDQEKSSKLNVESLHTVFQNESQDISRHTQKQLIKWSQKTSLINISSTHYSSLLMQTPVGQAKKILSNWDRVKGKCQHKRGIFRILFQDEQNVRITSDPQIFDDFQLFAELEKTFINSVEDEKDFRVSDTLRYLKNRQNREQKTKQVDRKASKNRKIRFNVHPKLLNFLPSYQGNLIEARDQIVQNFFNCKARQAPTQKAQQDGQTYYIDM